MKQVEGNTKIAGKKAVRKPVAQKGVAKKATPKKAVKKPVLAKAGRAVEPTKKAAAKKAVVKKTGLKAARVKTPAAKKMPPKKILAKKPPAKKTALVSSARQTHAAPNPQELLRDVVLATLDQNKAESIVCIDVREQSSFTDFLIIASGRSTRQVKSLAEMAQKALLAAGVKKVRLEGVAEGNWGVVDGGDVILHIFRPEVRAFYRLEEVWGVEPPLQETFRDL